MKELHAGYASGAVLDLMSQLDPELDWHAIIRSLCYFAIDHDIGGEAPWPAELSIVNNLISRGLPTLASIHLERFLAKTTGLIEVSVKGEAGVTGMISTKFKDPPDADLKSCVERALCIYSPGADFTSTKGFELPDDWDVASEREFFQGPICQLLGIAGAQVVARQRPFKTLIRSGDHRFVDQRVDFCVELPGSRMNLAPEVTFRGMIFELDRHHTEPQRILDNQRDWAAKSVGWLTCRRYDAQEPIPINDRVVKLVNHPYMTRLRENTGAPLQNDPIGRRVLNLVLGPLAVGRVQKTLLEAVRGGILQIDRGQWRIAIVEQDGPCAEAAVEDFRLWLQNVHALYQPGLRLPDIDLKVLPAWKPEWETEIQSMFPQGWTADLVIDVSVLLRHGLQNLKTEEVVDSLPAKHCVRVRSIYFRTGARVHSYGERMQLRTSEQEAREPLLFFLSNIFRRTDFRERQFDIIMRALSGRSVIGLLPTGAGKSLTYQMAALLQNGMAIVIEPIKSLMKDQVDELKKLGIDSAVFINSTLKAQERKWHTEWMQKGYFKFVFVSPERLVIQEFREALANLFGGFFCLGVVDEAHCVSEWGHDFRTAYLRTGANLRQFCSSGLSLIPILALTGTASHEVLGDVKRELEFEGAEVDIIIPQKMEREELHFCIIPLQPYPQLPVNVSFQEKSKQIGRAKQGLLTESLDCIANCFGSNFEALIGDDGEEKASGLVFCPHRRWVHGCEDIKSCINEDFPTVTDRVGFYYGSSDDTIFNDVEAVAVQDKFKDNRLRVLACTKAFGMGINKPNIRFTVHFNMPQSLEAFYQEAGRAGRDRERAECWLLYAGPSPNAPNEPSVDWKLMHAFYQNNFRGREQEERLVMNLLDENRMPGPSACRALCHYLDEELGGHFRAKGLS